MNKLLRAGGLLGCTLVVVVAGCSSDSTGSSDGTQPPVDASSTTSAASSSSGGLPDPCELLTTEQVASETGLSFGPGTPNDQLSSDERKICDWITDGSDFATVQTLVVEGDISDAEASAADALGGVKDVSVPGADAAYATTEGSIVGMQVGDLFVQVSYIPAGPGDVTDVTLALAADAVAQL